LLHEPGKWRRILILLILNVVNAVVFYH